MSWQGVKAELERIELDEGELLGVLLNFTTDVTGWNKKIDAPNYTNQIGHLQVKSAVTFREIRSSRDAQAAMSTMDQAHMQ